jgi:hypothetical protein
MCVHGALRLRRCGSALTLDGTVTSCRTRSSTPSAASVRCLHFPWPPPQQSCQRRSTQAVPCCAVLRTEARSRVDAALYKGGAEEAKACRGRGCSYGRLPHALRRGAAGGSATCRRGEGQGRRKRQNAVLPGHVQGATGRCAAGLCARSPTDRWRHARARARRTMARAWSTHGYPTRWAKARFPSRDRLLARCRIAGYVTDGVGRPLAVLSSTKYGLRQTRGKFGMGAKMARPQRPVLPRCARVERPLCRRRWCGPRKAPDCRSKCGASPRAKST